MGLLRALHERLSADAGVAATLKTYKDLPAVLTSYPIPEPAVPTDLAPGVILVFDPDDSDEALCKDLSVRERGISLDFFADESGSQLAIEDAVEAVVEALDGKPVSWPGWIGVVAATDAGERIDADSDLIGWTINARFINQKEGT